MSITCPQCLEAVADVDVHSSVGWAVCRNCDGFFAAAPEDTLPPTAPERPEKARITVERNGDELTIHEPACRGFTGWLFTVGLVFFGFLWAVCAFHVVFPAPDFPRSAALIFSLPVGAFATGMFYFVYVFQLRSRVLRFGNENLQVEERCLGRLRKTETIPRSHLLDVLEDFADVQGGSIREVRICYDKTAVGILCRSTEEMHWISAVVRDFLAETENPRYRCPNCFRGQAVDRSDFEHRCPWCRTKFTLEEAEAEGRKDFEHVSETLRPLYSRIGVEENGDSLRIRIAPWGLQSADEWFVMLLFGGLHLAGTPACLAVAVASFFVNPASGWSMLGVAAAWALGTGFLFWLVTPMIFEKQNIVISPEGIRQERKMPFLPTFVRSIKIDSPNITVRKGGQPVGIGGKHPVSVYVGDKRFALPCSGSSEQQWLYEIVRNFVRNHRLGPERLVPMTCSRCATRFEPDWETVLPEDFADGADSLRCPHCGKELLEHFLPDPLAGPEGSTAVLRKQDGVLTVEIPSMADRKDKSEKRSLIGLMIVAVPLFVGIHGWMGMRFFLEWIPIIRDLGIGEFFWPIVGACAVWIFCTLAGLGMAYAMLAMFFARWSIRIDGDTVETHWQVLCFGRRRRYPKTGIRLMDASNRGFGLRARIRPGYWLDPNPAWGRDALVLTTPRPFAFSCANDEEKRRLQEILQRELEE